MENYNFIPWVEKYRPKVFTDIVLNKNNKSILQNIIKKNFFPNLLFYGPPGTGKTTTICNLIELYQKNNNEKNKGLMIHLNASDDRGIDIIRNQIYTFVNSKPLYSNGIKFIILDEVDYMTKNAQQALRFLIQHYYKNVRFCLICNYISKIDESLKEEIIKLRFNQLPKNLIFDFLNNIIKNEEINISTKEISDIINNYKSDIRSMINYIQSNKLILNSKNIIGEKEFSEITTIIKKSSNSLFLEFIKNLSIEFNIDIPSIIKSYFNYLLNKDENINGKLLKIIEIYLHNNDILENLKNNYLFYSLKELFLQ